MAANWNRLLALAQEEIRATIAELPPELRERAEPLPVVYERVPPPDMLDEVVQPEGQHVVRMLGHDAFPDVEHAVEVAGFREGPIESEGMLAYGDRMAASVDTEEATALRIGWAYQNSTDWHTHVPAMAAL